MLDRKAVAIGVATVIMAWILSAIIAPLLLMTIGMITKRGEEGQQKIHQAGRIAQELIRVNIWGQAVYSRATLTVGNNTITTLTPDLSKTPTIMTFTNSWGGESVIDYAQVIGWNDEILAERSFDRGEFRIGAGQTVTVTPEFLGLGSDYKFFQDFKAKVSSVRLHSVLGSVFGSGYGAPSDVGDVSEVREQVVETVIQEQKIIGLQTITERIEKIILPDGTIRTKFPDGRIEVEFPNGLNVQISGETTSVATKLATQTSISVKGWSPDENTAGSDDGNSRATLTTGSVTSYSWLPAEGDLRCRDLNENGRQDPEEMFASNCYIIRAFEPRRSESDNDQKSDTKTAEANDYQRRRESSGRHYREDGWETTAIKIRDFVFLSLNNSYTGFLFIFFLIIRLAHRAFLILQRCFRKP